MNSPDRERLRFALIAFGALAALLLFGVFVADPLVAAVRPVVELLARMTGLAAAITPDAQGWTVLPAHPPVTRGVTIDSAIQLEGQTLRLMLRGFPLFLALMLAPPWDRRLAIRILKGLAILIALYAFSCLAVINQLMAQLALRIAETARTLPPGALEANTYSPLAFFAARLLSTLAISVLPLISPVILWALLKPEAVRLLLRGGRDPA